VQVAIVAPAYLTIIASGSITASGIEIIAIFFYSLCQLIALKFLKQA
jgi:hypothetical protein